MAESVELATILLTDLVGSTRLATSVGPVRADELREEHFGLLRDAIASWDGREVKNTGDGLMVVFSSPSAAVQCAVVMQQLLERRYRRAEQGLHLRIGLGAGESTVKDGDYFGMPTVEAARLCAQAPADEILVSGAVRMLAARCEGVEFSSVGELELKGFEEPVPAFSVSWSPLEDESARTSRWPLPVVLRSAPLVRYVGRLEERGALREAMNLARSGQRQVVLLSGEPGIGKTRLASFGSHDAHAEGFAIAWGACTEELAVPYEPWIGVCTQLVESAPDELLGRHIERHKGELRRLARNLEGRVSNLAEPQSMDQETQRYLLFDAVAGLLGEVAETVALCVVLDDLHWADAQSVALLKHLLRSTEQRAILVIATYRDSELGKEHPLTSVLADLRRLDGVQRLALHGLGAGDVAEIMSAVAGHELDPDGVELASQIAGETDGNPFFVGEILRGLSESGALVFDEASARWSIDTSGGIALPESVREVIERRVERLGEESVEALRLAAVVGREFDLELLSAVVEIDEGRLLDDLESAVAASVLAESSDHVGRFRFVHALINQTLYDGLGATRRARMHQRVAQALEEVYGAEPVEHLAELALHWRLAAISADKAKAADYALKAGRRALESLAPGEAVKYFTDAAELGGDVDSSERCEALIGLGEAQLQTGDAAFRETLLEASRMASELQDAEPAARASLANSRGWWSTSGVVDAERLAAIERAIELDDPPNRARRARLLALQALELTWDPDFARRRALAEGAIELARGVEDKRALAEVLLNASKALWSAQTLKLRAPLAEELVRRAEELGDPALRQQAADLELHVRVEQAELARAQAAHECERRIAAELGRPAAIWQAEFHTAGLAMLRGELVTGERLAERAFQTGQDAGEPDAVFVYGVQLLIARLCQGRVAELIDMIEQAVDSFPAVPGWRAAFAAALSWLDRQGEAKTILEHGTSDGFEHVVPSNAWSTTLAFYADATALTGDTDAAVILYRLIEPCGDQIVWTGASGHGHARMWLGLLAAAMGNHEQADKHLAFASEFHEANYMPIWTARGQLGWAESLAARGDPTGAREHATRALDLSREHGYGAFEPRAAALLAVHPAAEA